MPEVHDLWTLLAVVAVLAHQAVMMWIQGQRHVDNRQELEAIQSQLTECRARWETIERQMAALGSLVRFVSGGGAHPPGTMAQPPRQPQPPSQPPPKEGQS